MRWVRRLICGGGCAPRFGCIERMGFALVRARPNLLRPKAKRTAQPNVEVMATLWNMGGLTCRELARRVWSELREDSILGWSAQLSFYFLLSIFPTLFFLLALFGYFVGQGTETREALVGYLGALAPESATQLVDRIIRQITEGASGGKLAWSLLVAAWAGSSGMAAIISALNIAYEVEETRPWWKARLVAIGLMLMLVLLMSSALVLLLYGAQLAELVASYFGLGSGFSIMWSILRWPVVLAFVLLAFNLLYLYAPNLKHWGWKWLMPGTVVGVGLWLLASIGFDLYLSYFNTYEMTYGSLGTVVVLLLWFYLTGIAILVGGEVNSEIERASDKIAQAPN